MLVICAYCGKHISRTPKEVKKYKHSFCNKDHYFRWKVLQNMIDKGVDLY